MEVSCDYQGAQEAIQIFHLHDPLFFIGCASRFALHPHFVRYFFSIFISLYDIIHFDDHLEYGTSVFQFEHSDGRFTSVLKGAFFEMCFANAGETEISLNKFYSIGSVQL
jgi:hypothetical protein